MSGGLPSAPLGRERAGHGGRQIMTVGDPGEVVLWTRLTARFALRSETPIAAFLGITLAAIHCVCQGRAQRGIRQRRKRMDRIGCQRRRQGLESLQPEPLSERLRGSPRSLAQRLANARQRSRFATTAGAVLLDRASFRRDSAWADVRGVVRNPLSKVRAGRPRLGPRPRLRILKECAPFETERVEAALDAPAALAQAVRDSEAA